MQLHLHMRGTSVLAMLATSLLSVGCQSSADPALPTNDLVISNAQIVDGTGSDPFPGSIVVRAGRIVSVLPSGQQVPDAVEVIDGSGMTVIPGLWDMHVHLAEVKLTPEALPGFIASGVTSVRDAGGYISVLERWDQEVSRGQRIGPRIYAGGPTVNGPGSESADRRRQPKAHGAHAAGR